MCAGSEEIYGNGEQKVIELIVFNNFYDLILKILLIFD
jgi:hypothetical protein